MVVGTVALVVGLVMGRKTAGVDVGRPGREVGAVSQPILGSDCGAPLGSFVGAVSGFAGEFSKGATKEIKGGRRIDWRLLFN